MTIWQSIRKRTRGTIRRETHRIAPRSPGPSWLAMAWASGLRPWKPRDRRGKRSRERPRDSRGDRREGSRPRLFPSKGPPRVARFAKRPEIQPCEGEIGAIRPLLDMVNLASQDLAVAIEAILAKGIREELLLPELPPSGRACEVRLPALLGSLLGSLDSSRPSVPIGFGRESFLKSRPMGLHGFADAPRYRPRWTCRSSSSCISRGAGSRVSHGLRR